MTPAERARDHIKGIRYRADSFDEPIRSELIAIAVTLGNMMSCFDKPPHEQERQIPDLEYPIDDPPRNYDEALSRRWLETQ